MKTSFIENEKRWLGARGDGDGTRFRVWSPEAKTAEVVVLREGGKKDFHPMERDERGYFETRVPGVRAHDRYKFRMNGEGELPDPASRYQPEGPHGPSEVIETDFAWTDAKWKGHPLDQLVIYELHVGTFSPEGTFEGVRKRLKHFKELGVNAIEIMPVAQFAGKRNWGYDGVGLFATQNSYGDQEAAPLALKRLVNE